MRWFSGNRPVFLGMITAGGLRVTLRANGQTGVRPTAEFRQAVEELLGPGQVTVIGPMRVTPTQPMTVQPPIVSQDAPLPDDESAGEPEDAVLTG